MKILNILMNILWIPFIVQAFAMFFDEFYFHRRRRLPRWEAYGHPLDTLSVVICYSFLYFSTYSKVNGYLYTALVAISCLMVTKDEWVHKECCDAEEQWLHSILFILHPLTLGISGIVWAQPDFRSLNQTLLLLQISLTFCWMGYQFLYWRTRWI